MLLCIVGSIQTLLARQSKKREHFKAQREGPDLAQSVWVKDAASDTENWLLCTMPCMGRCWLLQNQSRNALCFPVQSEKGNQHQSPMDGIRRSPKCAESSRVRMEGQGEGDHRTELRFSFPKALTRRRMGRSKLRGTRTKRHQGIAFPSP